MERIFEILEKMTTADAQSGFSELLQSLATKTNNPLVNSKNKTYDKLSEYLDKVIELLDTLCNLLHQDDDILISVKQQKILRSSLQNVTSLGMSMCLIPGVGISLSKKAPTSGILPKLNLDDQQKYTLLVICTEFFTRIYEIPVFRKMIVTFHLSEYLAALIQLSYAPLKKPGNYENFVMTSELYNKLMHDKKRFAVTYEQVITTSFQPILMKELLVLQSVTDPLPPPFLKRTVSKSLSSCLLAPGGLLSLIKCFMECYTIDSGLDWKKNNMICKIITVKHGTGPENEYLSNICSQLSQILSQSNHHYLQTALLCLLSLHEKYPRNGAVIDIYEKTFKLLDHDHLLKSCNISGTVAVTPEEVAKKIEILDICINNHIVEKPYNLLKNSLYLLFQIHMQCQKEDLKQKTRNAILKCFDCMERDDDTSLYLSDILFGKTKCDLNLKVESVDEGILIKVTEHIEVYPISEAATHFLKIFHKSDNQNYLQTVFETFLKWLLVLIKERHNKNRNYLLELPDPSINTLDEKYSVILQMLSEISSSDKLLSALKTNPSNLLNFVECILLNTEMEEDCITISLVLLNTILSSSTETVQERCSLFIPILNKISQKESNVKSILCKETLNLLKGGNSAKVETACEKAIADVFDNLLPVRAHGIIELTKLIAANDLVTLSKKHYLLCLFQQQLKDSDSYIYLSAINGIAALGVHCPEEVLEELAKEYIQMPNLKLDQNSSVAEIRLKVGDVIVKVTKSLGDLAVAHKTLLLNTVLCVCRDEDPLLRTSALSNLAEIARVLNYKMGSIIYEVLILIWETIETDKAVECRRAAVLVITNLLKGLGQETLVQLKDKLLPIYRTLKTLYRDDEDSVVRLHAQIALEELNDIVCQFLKTELKLDERIFIMNKPDVI